MEVEVQQTLHGYADGHQLLGGSLSLSSAQDAQMLVLSDLSGPEFRSGFDGYLTGYPLDRSGYYVLARTWFATEMPRPGCVWTHSLLFKEEDLPRIRNLDGLPFRRPTSIEPSSFYDHTSVVQLADTWTECSATNPDVGAMLWALYSTNSTVVIPSAAAREDAALAVFLQQWPRLRRSFRFCTGALMPRDRSFDLVLAPHEAVRGVHGKSEFVVPDRSHRGEDTDWLDYALQDLRKPDTDYRLFLWRHGPDFANGRSTFAFLTRTYVDIANNADKPERISRSYADIATLAPLPTDAARLKVALFGDDGAFAGSKDLDQLVLTWHVLSERPCLDDQVVALERRVDRLASSQPAALAWLFLPASQRTESSRVAFVAACVAAARTGRLNLRSWDNEAVHQLVRQASDLLTTASPWERAADQQEALFRLIHHEVVDAALRTEIQQGFLRRRQHPLVELAIADWPTDSIRAFVGSAEDAVASDLLPLAERVLARSSDAVAEAMRDSALSALGLRLCAAFLDTSTAEVRAIPIVTWFPCAGSGQTLPNASLELKAKVFFLIMSLRATAVDASPLVAEAFVGVYEAAAEKALRDAQWDRIERELPSYGWDRCKALIRGLVEVFVRRRWALGGFAATFRTERTWRRAVRHLRRIDDGMSYLYRLRQAQASGSLLVDHERARDLHDEPWWPL